MEIFSDSSQIKKEKINMHTIFNHVKMIAENGFAKDIKFYERFDPSLPDVDANKDLLIQVFLNLIKNSSEAIKRNAAEGEITLSSSFLSSVRISLPTTNKKIELPLCFSIEDNGGGIAEGLFDSIFDPFISSKKDGKGLGLAIVSKIIQDHDGVIECQLTKKGTKMSILLPISK
jgi:two-component system nitrogen regulation sensor histidine kinase GlnL